MNLIFLVAAMASSASCVAPANAGDNRSSQVQAYSYRSVEIVEFATGGRTHQLSELVSPTAKFSLGIGDVKRDVGSGTEGAIAFAQEINAESFEFNGLDYIPMKFDPCGKQQVEVRFHDKDMRSEAIVKFEYELGVLVSADGWLRTLNHGNLTVKAGTHG